MPKKRNKENLGLPARWRFYHGAYYYQVPPKQRDAWDGKSQFKLGTSLSEAYRTWSERLVFMDKARTIAQLLDRYALEVVPTKSPKTQINNNFAIARLRGVFGHIPITQIEPQMLYQYRDKRQHRDETGNLRGVVAANREISLFSHVYTKAVEWGLLARHPFKGQLRLGGEKPRTRYVEDWELIEALSLPATRKEGSVIMIQAYMRLKLLTGLRRGDLLRLEFDKHIKEDGIHITTHKTKKPVVYEWSDKLREAVDMAKKSRPVDISPFLFCNKYGQCYVDDKSEAHGWASMWHRFMARVLKETELKVRFTDHDIRAKTSSDAKELDHARALLSHADERTTQRIYRRKPERVKPLQ